MKRIVLTLVVLCLMAGAAEAEVYPAGSAQGESWGVVPGVIIVKLSPGVAPGRGRSTGAVATGLPVLDRVASDVRASSFHKVFPASRPPLASSNLHDLSRFYRLEFDVVRDPAQVALEVAADPSVDLAEVVTWHLVDQFIPNDPEFVDQWHHMEGPQPTQDNDIDSPEAWDIQTGDPDVKIVIMDTGVLWYHPDLVNQIWVNPGEDLDGDGVVYDVDDLNGIDDDGNGYIDDLIGWDFVAAATGCHTGEDCTVADNDPRDYNGHGTHVAGIAASATNNLRDGAGVAGGRYPLQRGCLIMPARCGWHTPDLRGAVRTDYVGEAVNYAVTNGALVGNLSAGASASSVLASALNNAFANGFIFCKSAGNDNNSVADAFDDYFSTLAVASTTKSDTKSSFSTYGIWVDLSAPGSDILSTYGREGIPSFASLSGTSMSSPVVAGCAALMYANNPTFTKAQIESILFTTADSIDHLNLPIYAHMLGAGRVNIGAALASVPQAAIGGAFAVPAAASSSGGTSAALTPDSPLIGIVPLQIQFTDQSPGTPTGWLWDFGDGNSSADQSPLYTYNTPGVFDVVLDATHPGGEGRKKHQNAVVAHADTASFSNGKNCPGRRAVVEVNMTNALDLYKLVLPLTYQGPGEMVLDSFSFEGSRVAYFEDLDDPFSSANNKFKVFKLTANKGGGSPPLAPGSGKLLTLFFELGAGVPSDTLSAVDTLSILNFHFEAETKAGIVYVPTWEVGGVDILSYCRGDFNLSGGVNATDIIALVGHVFKSGPPSSDPWTMDVNLDGAPTAQDIIFLVNFAFKSGPAPE